MTKIIEKSENNKVTIPCGVTWTAGRELWCDFDRDGESWHGEIPYQIFREWLRANGFGPILNADRLLIHVYDHQLPKFFEYAMREKPQHIHPEAAWYEQSYLLTLQNARP